MKKVMIIALALVASASFLSAEAAKKKQQVVQPVVVEPVVLNNSSDSVSYTGGMAITNGLVPYLQQQGVDTAYMADFIQGFKEMIKSGDDPKKAAYVMGMDIAKQLSMTILPNITKEFTDTPDSIVKEKLLQGFSAALENDTTLFTQKAAEEYFRTKQQLNKEAKQEKLYGANRDAGRKFLEENAKKDSVVTLPSGLQYQVLVKGEGEVPQATDRVKVHYEGRLIDGTVFDASARHGGEPAEFTPQQVIPGWTEALTMMPVGSKWRLFIPYDLAYGDRDQGQIKPYSTLIFDVELVEIVKK
ncbi:MAG: FKBP-type peptidyl-prolyl cis-trans isomerase [Prevotella sp.]|nr:FKBP-type peptidyl-prolyl cis-trans isomerase [Prevotella sp.]